ncbi:MAG: GGDEF domain-containing protein [Treponema sp.]|nr:GGDEF domain-containing protein [Treponema sp.]
MDFQALVDSCEMAAAVLSVQKTDDGHYGDIRIVRANEMYKKIMGPNYRDNMIYSDLIPKEPNFEDFCYRCAVLKQHLHAYIDTKSMGVWIDGTYIPLSSNVDYDDICHFLFFFEFNQSPESQKMSDISAETASFVIKTCINLRGTESFYDSMKVVISDIQKQTESFCSSIIMVDKEREKYATLCAKFSDDKITMDDFAPYLTPDVVFSWEETLKMRDIVIIKDEYDMAELEKQNPVWVKSLRGAGVKSLLLVPLSQGKKMFGVLFVSNFNVERLVEIKEFIELTAFFLSSEIANNDLMERLEFMSNVDFLTNVKNRNSMNARVDFHVSGKRLVLAPFGVIFADLNGLKQQNDSGGHEAGDNLLKNAALLLKKHFEDNEIYRSGGDEFVVIVPNCKKAKFEEKVAALRAESGYGAEVSLAIGADWSDKSDDLRLCMHNADEAMYADKNKFYNDHPDMARK